MQTVAENPGRSFTRARTRRLPLAWCAVLLALVCLAAVPSDASAAGTWSVQNPTTVTLNGSACADTSTCWAVGANGTIVGTTDGGTTWSPQVSGTRNNLNSIACPTSSRCLVVGNKAGAGTNGAVLTTDDGGSTWTARNSGTSNNLTGVSCANATTCWAVGQNGSILRSTDAGATWAAQSSGTTSQLNGIACPSTTHCFAVGKKAGAGTDAEIRVTTDGGATWAERASIVTQDLNEIACASTTACRAVGQAGTIVASSDGGATWAAQASGTTVALTGIACASETMCRATGQNGTIRASNDASSWSAQTSGRTVNLNTAACADTSTCIVAGATGAISGTTDGGSSWSPQTSGVNAALQDVACASTASCWAVGQNGVILATDNGGAVWSPRVSGVTKQLNAIACSGGNTCYAVGATNGAGTNALILKTVDGGATWAIQNSNTTAQLFDVACVNATTCWAVGQNGVIVTTTNGVNWAAQPSGVTKQLNAVTCPAATTCYAVGANNGAGTNAYILKTLNGGTHWTTQNSGAANQLHGVRCASTTACWAVGQDGRIAATTNGSTWTGQTSGTTVDLRDVACGDSDSCWAVGNTSGGGTPATILATTNGSTWSAQTSNTTSQLLGVAFVGTSYGWAVGHQGTVAAYVDDTTPPDAPTIETEPYSPGAVTSPLWAFAGEDGATFECRVDRGSDVIAAWASCSDEATFDLSDEADGTYTFSVRATDAAGNTGAPAESDYTLDTTAPVAPTIDAAPADFTASRTPSWSFTADPGTETECRLDNGSGQVFGWGPCSGTKGYALIAQPDDAYTFSVRATDDAGNVGPAATDSFTLDTQAPATPLITLSPASPDDSESPAWTFSGDAGATLECRLDRGATPIEGWTTCATSRGYDLSGEPDGNYTFSVRATDAAGNVSALAVSHYVLDTTAPAIPTITSAPGSPSLSEDPEWAWTGEGGASFECSLDPENTGPANWGPCTSPEQFDLSGESDGTYTFSVRASDAVGNTSTAAESGYTLDRAAPEAPTIDSGPPTIGSALNPAWSFSAPAATGYECRLSPGLNPAWAWGPCASPRDYDLTGEPEGTYTFSVRAIDGAETSAATTGEYTLDRTKPDPPDFSTVPASPGNSASPAWTVSAEPGATLECELTRAGAPVTVTTCGTNTSADLASEPDGTYALSVRARDAAGNLSDPRTGPYVLDTAAPVTGITSSPASPRGNRLPNWSFDAEPGAEYECRLDRGATSVSGWGDCDSPVEYDLAGKPEGTYTFSVKATDEAGNTGATATGDYVLDATAPSAPSIVSEPASPGPSRSPSWTIAGDSGATLRCRLDSPDETISGWAPCSGVVTYDLTGEPDVAYTFSVQATDGALNDSAITTRTYVLDTTAPPVPDITTAPGAAGASTTPSWSFTGEGGATFECRLDRGATQIAGWSSCTGSRSYDLTGQSDGVVRFSVRARDAVGNVGPARTDDYELVTTPPAAPAWVTEPVAAGSSPNPSWTFTGPADADLECRLDRGTVEVDGWAPCLSPRSFDLSSEPDGTYELSVRAVNGVGLHSAVIRSRYIFDTHAPDAPTFTSTPGAAAADTTPAWVFTAELGATFECRVERGTDVVSDWDTCTSPHAVSLVGRPDGDFRFLVRAQDAAGNTSPVAHRDYKMVTSTPGAPRITAAPNPVSSKSDPSWSFTGDAGAVFDCRLTQGANVVSDWGACASPRVYDLSSRGDGDYEFSVRARNSVATLSAPVRSGYVLDRAAPDAPAIADAPDRFGNDRTPSWSFSAEAGSAVECRLREGRSEVDWTGCASPRRFSLANRDDGAYTFEVRATDAAGNTSDSSRDPYELDTKPPAAPKLVDTPPASGTDRSPTWVFTGESGASYDCLMRHGRERREWDECTSPKRYRVSKGEYAFSVRATDRAGNVGDASSDEYRVVAAPAGGPPDDPAPSPPSSPQPAATPPAPTPQPASPADNSAPGPSGGSDAAEPIGQGNGSDSGRSDRAASGSGDRAKRTDRPAAEGTKPEGAKPGDDADKSITEKTLDAVKKTFNDAKEIVVEHADESAFPLSLLLLVGAFLMIQGRIDRNDPKLAMAPVQADTDVEFGPPVKRRRGPLAAQGMPAEGR